ncbi:MAG: XdhC family protein [Myxococcales bacterium]|nr:XdhC family protein [Myxococcales bacterium]
MRAPSDRWLVSSAGTTIASEATVSDQSETEVLLAARGWRAAGHRVALATVVQTWGSSPRPAGSHLAVRDDSLFVGSVSGGCVEGRVVEEALQVMQTGAPKLLEFGVSNDEAWEVGLACGGRVEIFVEALE